MSTEYKKVAVLTGGTGYVGSAIAAELKKLGWEVAILARNISVPEGYTCDIGDEQSVHAAIKSVVEKYGTIHACIHAASAPIDQKNKMMTRVEVGDIDLHLRTTVRGAWLLTKTALPHMQPGSCFIGITTTLIEPGTSLPPLGGYILAKYALRGFLRTLAAEVKGIGIRVYAVAPGFMFGGLNQGIPDNVVSLLAQKSGAGVTSSGDVAKLIAQLCDTPSSFDNGVSITLPGKVTTSL